MNEALKKGSAHAALNAEMNAQVETAPDAALYQLSEAGEQPTAQELLGDGMKRRAFLQRMGAVGLGFAAIGLINGCNGNDNNGGPTTPTPSPTGSGTPSPTGTGTPSPTATPQGIDPRNFPGIIGRNIDEVVLNFTLSHEHLEVDLYRQALNIASGLPIATPLSLARTYALRIALGQLNADSGQTAQDGLMFLRNQAFVETAHRDFLITTIKSMGGTPQPPNPAGYQFPDGPGNTLSALIANIITVEQNGQRGLLGGAPFFSNLLLMQTGGTLHSIECRHIAALKHTIGRPPGPEREADDLLVTPNYPSEDTFEYYRTPPVVIARDRRYMRTTAA